MVDSTVIRALAQDLAARIGRAHVLAEPEQLVPYGHDESNLDDAPPQLVVRPGSAEEVAAVLALAIRHGVPVTPSAARSGKSGGSLPVEGGLVLSVERLSAILDIRRQDLVGVAQAGVITGQYQAAVEAAGLFYPPDPSSLDWCTLGGNVAENAGGPRAVKYGVTRDYILALQVALPSGELLRFGKQTIKGVAGFDLVSLMVGSEGMLGVVTEITTKLLPLPRAVETALALFRGTEEASRAVSAVLSQGFLPRALEFIDDAAIAASAAAKAPFQFPHGVGAALLIEVDGNEPEACLAEIAKVGEVCAAHGALEVLVAQGESQRRDLWNTRRQVSVNLKALHPRKLSEDIVVPRSRIPEAVAEVQAIGRRHGLAVACYGHAGDGNLHANVLFDRPDERPQVDAAVAEMLRMAVALGGTITGEHGVGLAKREFLGLEQSREVIALQRRLKTLFDPSGLLNPGKMFPSQD
jgi:glycolate oxidase